VISRRGDEVYGANRRLLAELEARRVGHLLAVARDQPAGHGLGQGVCGASRLAPLPRASVGAAGRSRRRRPQARSYRREHTSLPGAVARPEGGSVPRFPAEICRHL
jgi:hypothetical protein